MLQQFNEFILKNNFFKLRSKNLIYKKILILDLDKNFFIINLINKSVLL
jgi:hypothetical protein